MDCVPSHGYLSYSACLHRIHSILPLRLILSYFFNVTILCLKGHFSFLKFILCFYYRPQTKFAKVIFLHVSVSHSVHRGGVCLSACWDTSPRAEPPPPLAHPPSGTPPPAQSMLEDTVNARAIRILLNAILFHFNLQRTLFVECCLTSWDGYAGSVNTHKEICTSTWCYYPDV